MKLNQRQLDALGHIVDHCQKASVLAARLGTRERLESEWETRYAIIRCVEVVGEATRRLGPQFEGQHPGVPWRLIAGMRNRLIHGYDGIDLDLLWETISEDIPKLLPAVEAILRAEPPPGKE